MIYLQRNCLPTASDSEKIEISTRWFLLLILRKDCFHVHSTLSIILTPLGDSQSTKRINFNTVYS